MTEKLYSDYPYYFAMFPKMMKIISLVFLSSHRRTRERLGELENAVEKLNHGSRFHSISLSPKRPLVYLIL